MTHLDLLSMIAAELGVEVGPRPPNDYDDWDMWYAGEYSWSVSIDYDDEDRLIVADERRHNPDGSMAYSRKDRSFDLADPQVFDQLRVYLRIAAPDPA